MAQILIAEPHPEVRDLLVRIAQRLGHEAVVRGDLTAGRADVVLVEPADPVSLAVAEAARDSHGAAIVCVSTRPASHEARALEPVAYLLKPFSLLDLERALVRAVEVAAPAPAA